ncbi:MAG: hypothetical protein JJU28_11080 [Cyclobacteriaceae bacterium]|nr:hypothetical protein [Cyclobacteriaceae bacterium]
MKKFIKYFFLAFTGLIFLLFVVITGPYWWKRWVVYPQLDKEKQKLLSEYKQPPRLIDLEEFKGVMHMHSYWSHDSRGQLNEILSAAKETDLDFLFFSDHIRNKLDTFPRSLHGVFDGVIFEPGSETSSGLLVNPLQPMVIDWNRPESEIIAEVVNAGGFVGYLHTEKPHDWDNPDYQAMEIYNIHTDWLEERRLFPLLINRLVNGTKNRDWAFREIFNEQTAILANWEDINQRRKVTGFGAADAHNNQSLRARYTEEGKVEWVGSGAKTIVIREKNWLDRILLGEPDEAGWAYKWEIDSYAGSFNYVMNHVFADTLSSISIKESIVDGKLLVVFQALAPADGFQFVSLDAKDQVSGIIGDSVMVDSADRLKAVSPYPVKFELLKDGILIESTENVYEYEYKTGGQKGNYRLVALLKYRKQWLPWVYTNHIVLHD